MEEKLLTIVNRCAYLHYFVVGTTKIMIMYPPPIPTPPNFLR